MKTQAQTLRTRNKNEDYYLFGAPWLGSTESVKTRIDYFIEGKAGYINNQYVDYRGNKFYQARCDEKQFKERFIKFIPSIIESVDFISCIILFYPDISEYDVFSIWARIFVISVIFTYVISMGLAFMTFSIGEAVKMKYHIF